jgi:hypothetical protein
MFTKIPLTVIGLAWLAGSAPSLADDCATVKRAMLNSGHTPHTAVITKTDAQGKKTVTRQIQTVDNKYVQLPDGKWYTMNIATKDLDDDTSEVQTCRGSGGIISGEVVYAVHLKLDGGVSEQTWWVSSNNLVVKTDGVVGGSHYTVEYDFAHVTPPANSTPLGGR